MRTAVRLGAVAINYVEADELETNGGLVGAIVAATSRRKSASNCARRWFSMLPACGPTTCADVHMILQPH